MIPSPKNVVLVGRYARSLGISLLLLVALGLSFHMRAHPSQNVVPAASSVGGVVPGDDPGLRLPGRLNYRVEHSVCAAQLTDLSAVANSDDINASTRLPGGVYQRLLFQSASCA